MALNIVFPMLICLIAHISQNSVTHESDSSDNEQLLAFTLKKLEWFPCGASDIYNGSKAIATLSDICIKAASNFLGSYTPDPSISEGIRDKITAAFMLLSGGVYLHQSLIDPMDEYLKVPTISCVVPLWLLHMLLKKLVR